MPPDSAPVTSALRHGTPPCVSTLRPQPARRSASNAEAAGTGRGTAQGRLPAAQPAPGSPRLDALPLPPPALSGPLRSQRGAEPATSAASRGTGPATAPPPAAVPWGAAANSEAEVTASHRRRMRHPLLACRHSQICMHIHTNKGRHTHRCTYAPT